MKMETVLIVQSDARASAAAPCTWPDAYIEFWGEVYLANPALRRGGVLFEALLAAPPEILQTMLDARAIAVRTQLRAQAAVRERLFQQQMRRRPV
ncbi:MAG: hypothetical protein IT532_00165 [Burkholderiales bacterium]|nr:hypothetical protein [Burkholderiales bacterium]